MFIIRPITSKDLDGLMELLEKSGHGLTSLPRDPEVLKKRIPRITTIKTPAPASSSSVDKHKTPGGHCFGIPLLKEDILPPLLTMTVVPPTTIVLLLEPHLC
jgi:hypothetical protein